MQRRLLTFATRLAVACAFMGTVGCATILTGSSALVSINSTPSSANVEITRSDGIVVGQGQTPMTVKLGKGKDYTVTISLDGYQTQTVPVLKSGVETAAFCNQKWTPSFGQPGSGVKVDSMRFVRLPFAACIPPSEFCHGGGSSEVFPRCST